ncbi:hypothetical protein [Escherichia coli]|uniref:hypothetical protein n=1 Tax=Escherichia coli TaxID=562 RepID=UPI003B67ACF3
MMKVEICGVPYTPGGELPHYVSSITTTSVRVGGGEIKEAIWNEETNRLYKANYEGGKRSRIQVGIQHDYERARNGLLTRLRCNWHMPTADLCAGFTASQTYAQKMMSAENEAVAAHEWEKVR